MIRIVSLDEPQAYRSPDLVFDGERGDLALNPLSDADAPGDFQAKAAIATQVLICLMTDARVEPSDLREGDVNKGWPGDGFDMAQGEAALGSTLWQLRRSRLSNVTPRDIEDRAGAALETLIEQGLAARVDVTAATEPEANRAMLSVALYGRDGAVSYQDRFALLWDQTNVV
ncbi:phage GP46 family protein [uncultured Hoeflea sp.]|uniref:phage GP46 family protein n=1 Tax=uncultured Hoeflea sp. TaxID=538666 RepID=UPI00262F257E|nr:phage GP46 family protein [uncultured Hoeflea sp.]